MNAHGKRELENKMQAISEAAREVLDYFEAELEDDPNDVMAQKYSKRLRGVLNGIPPFTKPGEQN